MFGWKISLIEAKKIINFCLKNKIKFFDTSPSYGGGISEMFCGEILKSQTRKKFELSTKFNLINNKEKVDKFIKRSLNDSLKRLKTRYLDYYVLHYTVTLKKLKIVIKTIKELKKKKKIKNFILSNPSKSLLRQIQKNIKILDHIDGFQFKHNYIFKDVHIFEMIKYKKFKLISYSPLEEGILTGKYLKKTRSGRIFEATKHRKYYKSLLSQKNKSIISSLYKNSNKNHNFLIKKSYDFLLKDFRINRILIGVSSYDQLYKNIRIIKRIN